MPTQDPNQPDKHKVTLQDVGFILQALAFSVEILLRTNFGERYIDRKALVAILLLFFFPLFFPHDDCRWMVIYLIVYLLMCAKAKVMQRFTKASGRPGEEISHTRYNGWPRLMRYFPNRNERSVKAVIEPICVMLVGFLLGFVNTPLGLYLMFAAVSLFIVEYMLNEFERRRVMDLHDSILDQKSVAERFRRMNRDR